MLEKNLLHYKKVSFLIVNYYSINFLSDLVESIELFLPDLDYEVLIWDNSCSEAERRGLDRLISKPTLKLFFSESNIGFVKANNILANKACNDILIFINPDTKLIDTSLLEAIDLLNRDDIGIVGVKLLYADGKYQNSFYKYPTIVTTFQEHILFKKNVYSYGTNINILQECDYVKGACLIISKLDFNKLSGFDERFFMYSEEMDLCYRMKKLGKKVVYFPKASIIHYEKQSSLFDNIRAFTLFHYHRSKLEFAKKHYGLVNYFIVGVLIKFSLFEKFILLSLRGKFLTAKYHINVFLKLLYGNKRFE